MKYRDWMVIHNVKLNELVKAIGWSKGHISDALRGKRAMSLKLAHTLSQVTNNEITIDSLMNGEAIGPRTISKKEAIQERNKQVNSKVNL